MIKVPVRKLPDETAPLSCSRAPLVILELDSDDEVEEWALLEVADILGALREAPGVLVERDGRPYGTLTRADVAAALSLDLLGEVKERMLSLPVMPARRYICRRCEPPSRRVPRSSSGGPPDCSLVWAHGPMEVDRG